MKSFKIGVNVISAIAAIVAAFLWYKASVVTDADYFYNSSGSAKDHFVIICGSFGSSQGRVLIPA